MSSRDRVPIRELGEDHSTDEWQDYRAILPPQENAEEHLLQLLMDESFPEAPEGSPLPWVPLHAWRALAQLGSVAVIEPVLRLAEGHEYPQAYDDFAKLSGHIGDKAVEPLAAILSDKTHSEISRTLAAGGLGEIGRSASGPARTAIVELLMSQIRNNGQEDGWVNGAAAEALVAMREHSVGPEVLQLYDEGRIQIGMIRSAELEKFFGRQPG